jgi:hypothetical protein
MSDARQQSQPEAVADVRGWAPALDAVAIPLAAVAAALVAGWHVHDALFFLVVAVALAAWRGHGRRNEPLEPEKPPTAPPWIVRVVRIVGLCLAAGVVVLVATSHKPHAIVAAAVFLGVSSAVEFVAERTARLERRRRRRRIDPALPDPFALR